MRDATGELRADSASRITAPARVSLSCATYLEFARNEIARGPAWDSAATLSTVAAGSPRSSPPNRTASSPSVTAMAGDAACGSGLRGRFGRRGRRCGAARRGPRRARLQRLQYLGGDIDRRCRVNHAFRDHDVEALRLRVVAHLADQRTLQLVHFVVALGVGI